MLPVKSSRSIEQLAYAIHHLVLYDNTTACCYSEKGAGGLEKNNAVLFCVPGARAPRILTLLLPSTEVAYSGTTNSPEIFSAFFMFLHVRVIHCVLC